MRLRPRVLLALCAAALSAPAAAQGGVPEGPGLGAPRDTVALPPRATVVRLGPGVLPRSERVEALRGDAFVALPRSAYTLGADGVLRLAVPADSVVTLVVAYRRLPALAAVEGRLPLADTLAARDSARAAAPDDPALPASSLRTTGSISRGVVAGSNRDVSVTSGLRLQLSGEVAPGVDVRAALTDENTPVLPEGTTAQLQDLDRVYVEVAGRRASARLGDVDLVLPGTAFAPLQRKVQGAAVETSWGGPVGGRALASASATRGLFRSQDLVALDGVQGPYRLQGAASEPFVVVVPGSERVWLDGAPQVRGEAEDYVIDYATGELTFTPRHLITAERRITVDFEYTTGGFTRTLLAATAEGAGWRDARGRERLRLGARLFREADAAGFAAELGLSQADLDALAAAGDADVLVDGAEPVAFDAESPFVLYARRDTVDAAGAPLGIYVPATATSAEVFRVRFSRVATGQGTYRRGAQLQNGIVYEYAPGGDYVPFRTLPRPAARTLVDLAGSAEVLPGVEVFGEWARSVDDANTLSDLGDADDAGGATELGARFREARLAGGALTGELRLRARADRFRPLDRIRDVEFNRRWNLARAGTPFGSVLDTLGEDLTEAVLRWARGASAVEAVGGRLALGGWRADRVGGAVVLDSLAALPRLDARVAVARSAGAGPTAELLGTGRLVRADARAERRWGVWLPSLAVEVERREQETTGARLDTLLSQSYAFVAARPGVAYARGPLDLAASVEGRWEREPLAPLSAPTAGLPLDAAARAVTVETTAAFDPAGSFQGDARVAVRRKAYTEAFQALGRPDGSSVAIRLSARAAPFARALDGQLVYEALTERAPILQETYVLVGPDLGAFVWRDGGGEPRPGEPDGVAQLDEFFPETTPLEGTYLRTFVPSDALFPTVGAGVSLRLGTRPGRLWGAGAPDWLRSLATQTTVDLRERTRSDDVARVLLLDPSRLQQRDADGGTLSGRFRVEQTVTLWGDRPRQGARLALTHASSTSRLAAGLDTRLDQGARLDATVPLSARLLARLDGGLERSRSTSEAFASRTFDLRGVRAEPTLIWTPTAASAFQAGVALATRTDVLAPATRPSGALVVRLPVEARAALGDRLALTARAEAAGVTLRGEGAGGLALFELSEGRGPGTSFLWGGTVQAGLGGGVRASVTYDARAPSGAPLVQTVRATVSAVF